MQMVGHEWLLEEDFEVDENGYEVESHQYALSAYDMEIFSIHFPSLNRYLFN